MFRQRALPYLESLNDGVISSNYIKIYGIGESSMETMLKPYLDTLKGVTAAPYAKEGECEVRVTARGRTREHAESLCRPVVSRICEILGDAVYGIDVSSLEEVVVRGLTERRLTLALAESCTGGLLAKRITDIPGSSACFGWGCVSYSAAAKERMLGVSPATLAAHGAVSEETALEMARGVRALSGADIGLSVTGVAGPDASEGKPVGLVYIALSHAGGEKVVAMPSRYARDRARVRHFAASAALDLIRKEILR